MKSNPGVTNVSILFLNRILFLLGLPDYMTGYPGLQADPEKPRRRDRPQARKFYGKEPA